MLRPLLALALIALLAGLLVRCGSAEAAESQDNPPALQPPQLRMGFHAQGQPDALVPVAHLMFPDVVNGASPYLYAGLKHHPDGWRWNVETLLGMALTPDGLDPVFSLRVERSSPILYLWADLEYSPLNHHNLYGFATVALPLGSWLVGVDSENWVNLEQGEGSTHQVYWSVGPAVGAKLGNHVFLAESLLWTADGPIPRTYAQFFW